MRSFYSISILFLLMAFIPACTNIYESHEFDISKDSVLYQETFSSGFGEFKSISVSGTEFWKDTLQYALMTGYVGGVNKANETWLISPEIDLTDEDTVRMSFDHVTRYFANPATEATVWVSEDYQTDSLPAKATWTQIVTEPFTDPGSWTFNNSGQINMNSFGGKKIRVAFKYISTTSKAGTWELKNFQIVNRQAIVVKKNFGKGTETEPFNIAGGLANQIGEAWVSGYVVGYIWSGSYTNYVFGSDTCTQMTNLLIADTTNTYLSKCMPVQLPVGAVRTGLNLKENKSLIGRKVVFFGSLESYFGSAGLKNVSYYVLDNGTTGGTKPVKTIFKETFASSSQGAFTIQNLSLPSGLTSIWTTTPTYGMKGTAYLSGNKAGESWLISPAFSLAGVTKATLTFDQALNYLGSAKASDFVTVWVSLDYNSGLPSTGNWNQLSVPTYPAGNSFTFSSSGNVLLDDYSGEPSVRIAFKYRSTTSTCTTWEIKNVMVK